MGVVEGVVRGGAKGVANKWEESGRSQGEEPKGQGGGAKQGHPSSKRRTRDDKNISV